LIPDNIDDVRLPVFPLPISPPNDAELRRIAKGKTVLSPAIGGSVGTQVTQMAKAQGAKHAISTTTNHAKAQQHGLWVSTR